MAQKVPEDGWTMQDGTPWPGNNVRDHPGMIQVLLVLSSKILLDMFFFTRIFGRSRNSKVCFYQQVFLGHNGVRDIEGNELPRLIYVSREKRPGFEHHKKAGAMNALVSFLCVCISGRREK